MSVKQTALVAHSTVIQVRDELFASALSSIGVPFADPERPFTTVEYGDGTRVTTWVFKDCTADGLMKVMPLLVAQKDPALWIENNPEHPLTFALCGAMNAKRFHEAAITMQPLVGFKMRNGNVLYLYRDSRKAKHLLANGVKPIDAPQGETVKPS